MRSSGEVRVCLLLVTALTLVPAVPTEVRLLAGVLLLLTGPGLLLAPAYAPREPLLFWTLVLVTSVLVQFLSALVLLYLGTFAPLQIALLDLLWMAGLWALAQRPSMLRASAGKRT